VARSTLNLRRLNLLASSSPAAAATITNDTICCQSMKRRYAQNPIVQQIIGLGRFAFIAMVLTRYENAFLKSGLAARPPNFGL
jgi:hypothetical protein